MNIQELENPEVIDEQDVTLGSKVILFNDEWHTFEEVLLKLLKQLNAVKVRLKH